MIDPSPPNRPAPTRWLPLEAASALARPQLLHRLDGARVVWIGGPAGCGKSTLAAQHLARSSRTTMWYRLSPGDSEPSALLVGIAGCARRQGAPPLLTPSPPAHGRLRFADRPEGALLVLDGYQALAPDSSVHEGLLRAIEELPAQVQLVVTSRHPPPAAWGRLRVLPGFCELGWDHLRLSLEETTELAQRSHHAPRPINELWAHTQGWAIGLALTLGSGDAEGARSALFDYLEVEVWADLPPVERRLLALAALLPAPTAPALEALGVEADPLQGLPGLAQRIGLLWREGDGEYALHPQWRAFLLDRGATLFPPGAWRDAQGRAAGLLAAAGLGDAAVDHWRAAGDWATLRGFILAQAPAMLRRGQEEALAGWLAQLPEEQATDWTRYFAGACRLMADPAGARGLFTEAYHGFEGTGDGAGCWEAWIGAANSFIHEWAGFGACDPWLGRFEALWQTRREALPADRELAALAAYFSLLIYRRPHDAGREGWAERLEQALLASRDPLERMAAGTTLVIYHAWWTGDIYRAEPLIAALRPEPGRGGLPPPVLILWGVAEAGYAWMQADGARARAAVERGLAAAEGSGIHLWDFMLLAQRVWAALADDDLPAARQALDALGERLEPRRLMDHGHYCLLAFSLAWMSGQGDAMIHWAAQGQALADASGSPWGRALLLVATARSRLHLGDRAGALAALEESRRLSIDPHGALVAAAELALDEADPPRCRALLRPVLERGRRQGTVNAAYWRASSMSRLCHFALQQGLEGDYVRQLIQRRRLLAPADAPPLDAWPWPVRIQTLGGFRLELAGEAPAAGKGASKPLELLQALIACGADQVPLQRLGDLLWPDSNGDATRRTLDTNLFRLRRLLGDEPVVMLAEGRLSLDRRRCWCDLWALEATFAQLEGGLAHPGPALLPLADALHRLCRGPFLQAPHAPPWAHAVQRRIERHQLRLLPRLIEALEGLDAPARAERCRERLQRLREAIGERGL